MRKITKVSKIAALLFLCYGILLLFPAEGGSLQSTDVSYSAAANDLAQKLAAAFPKLTGYVLSAEGGTVYIDLGEKERVYPGMELTLYREGKPFTHPVTGEVLGRFETPLGKIRVLEVRDKFSITTQISKAEDLAVTKGDRVRMTGARIPLALPAVETPDPKGEEAKAIVRELALALERTERFEVWDERRLLSALQAEGISGPVSFSDPRVLEIMAKKLNVYMLGLGKLSGLFIDLQVFSTATKSILTIASAEVRQIIPPPPVQVAKPLTPETAIGKEVGKESTGRESIGREIGKEPVGKDVSKEPIGKEIARPIATPESINPPESARSTVPGAWKGPRFDKAMRSLVVADVNGDRQPELVVAGKNQIMIYSIDPTGYRLLYTTPQDDRINIISLDAADINGNGIPEIFATSYANGRLNSFALEYRDGKFQRIWENVGLFLRCLPTGPGGSYQLFGQALHISEIPLGKVHQYVWSNNRYQEGPRLDLPSQISLYGLALMDLDGDGKKEIITLSAIASRQTGEATRIQVYGADGKKKHRTSEVYGGTELSLDFSTSVVPPTNPTTPFFQPDSQNPVTVSLQPRLIPVPGKAELYACRNIEPAYNIMKDMRLFDKSKIFRLAWDGDALVPAWESKEFPQYMADYYEGDFDGDGVQELAILLVEEAVLSPDKSTTWIYKLN